MFRLNEKAIATLLAREEAGMGYQLLSARINGPELDTYVVLNCELAIPINEMSKIPYASVETLTQKADEARSFEIKELLNQGDLPPPTGGSGAPAKPLAPTPILARKTNMNEGFARVSAYPNDKRVLSDGSLVSGTYATTIADIKEVPSGFAAVGRYALPNPMSAVFVYVIVPSSPVLINGGTVRPAFYQAGGGVQVFFSNGAPVGSVFRPYQIPEI
jgi:hypothetical protein